MKTKSLALSVMLLCLIALAVKAQEFDTVLVRGDNTVLTVLKPKTDEKIISTLKFSGVNPDIFSDEEIRQLEKGKEVIKKSFKADLPVSLLPVIKQKKFWTTKTYGKDGETVKRTKPDIKVLGSEEKNFFLSLFWLYLPVLCIFFLSLTSAKIEKGRKKMIAFTISTFLAIVLAIIVGRFVGAFAGGFAGAFAGMFAGMFANIGFTLNSPEFHIIWHYLGIYLMVCLLAIGLIGLRKLFTLVRSLLFLSKVV